MLMLVHFFRVWLQRRSAQRSWCVLFVAISCLASTAQAQTTAGLTQVFDRPATSTLPLGTQFFTLQASEPATTLPLVSVVADQTSASVGPVTMLPSSKAAAPVVTPLSGETTSPLRTGGGATAAVSASPPPSLPIRVDKSSTAAQALQLSRFERQNHVGEAFLLASELMRENPDDEFAYDAAIRTSLVLGLHDDVEKILKLAVQKFPAQGKYRVQLAHLYQRTGRPSQLQAVVSEYEKLDGKTSGAPATLARLQAILRDKEFPGPGGKAPIPFSLVRQRAVSLAASGETTRLLELLTSAVGQDLTRWEARTLALEMANHPNTPAEQMLEAFRRALANEQQYEPARLLVDGILELLARNRQIDDLLHVLTSRATGGALTDPEAFIGARVTGLLNDMEGALYFAGPERSGATPLVAFERARLYGNAGRTSEALLILNNLLAEQPTDLSLRMLIAQQQAASGQQAAVLQTLAPLATADLPPHDRRNYVALVTSATISLRDPERLVGLWADLGRKLPWSDLQQMGDLVTQAAYPEELWDRVTSEALTRAKNRPEAWPVYGLLARISGYAGDVQAALHYYQKLIELDPENVPLLRFVAELATQHSSLSISLGPASAEPGEFTIHANDAGGTSIAMQLYQRLIELQPRLPENYSALMRVYQLSGEIEAAKRVAVELADRGSSTTQACIAAAGVLEENGLTTDSLVFYRAAVLESEDNFPAWMRYAGALRVAGKYNEAEIIYRRILENGFFGVPWNQPALFANLLAIAHDTHRVPELVQYLNSVRTKDIPGKAEFYLSSAKLIMQVGDSASAETFLREFQSGFPGSQLIPDSLLLLGQLQYTSGDLEGARATFMQVADHWSTSSASVVATFNAGEILRQSNKAAEAIALWRELARRFPEDDKALSALHEAALTAWTELRDAKLASELMEQFVSSGSLDQPLLKQANESLKRMAEGQPPLVE